MTGVFKKQLLEPWIGYYIYEHVKPGEFIGIHAHNNDMFLVNPKDEKDFMNVALAAGVTPIKMNQKPALRISELKSLPDLTKIFVVWSGGNDFIPYLLKKDGERLFAAFESHDGLQFVFEIKSSVTDWPEGMVVCAE